MEADQAAEGSSQQTQARLNHLTHHLDRERQTSATPDAQLEPDFCLNLLKKCSFLKTNSKSSFLFSGADDFLPCSEALTLKNIFTLFFSFQHLTDLSSEGEAAFGLAALYKCSG